MEKSIKTVHEGMVQDVNLNEIHSYLTEIAEVSSGAWDFAKNVGSGLNDEARGMESGDQDALEEWFHRVYLEM